MRVEHAVGVVARVEVVRGPRDHHAAVVGVAQRLGDLGDEPGRRDHARDHLRTRVDRERDRLGHPVGSVDRLVARLDGEEAAPGTHARRAERVVGLAEHLPRLAVRVAVDAVVGLRIVRVAVEVPARDVVHVAVAVVVAAVRERDDQVLGGDPTRLGVEERPPHARVVGPVVDVDHAVAVQVVGAVCHAAGVLRERQLARVQVGAPAQLGAVVQAPVHAALHVGDDDVVAPAVAELVPDALDAHAARALGIGGGRRVARQTGVEVPLLLVPRLRPIAPLGGRVVGVVRVGGEVAGAALGGRGRRCGKRGDETERGEKPERAGTRDGGHATSS